MLVPGHPRISVDPDICGGRPTVAGTRMRVIDIIESLADGATPEELLNDFPYLNTDDVRACLHYAAEALRHPAALSAE